MIHPYNQLKDEKAEALLNQLNELTYYHTKHCKAYHSMMIKTGKGELANTIEDLPYLPVQLFKLMDLKSITDEEVIKVLTSSGTTGQQVSKIYLNKETSISQSKALVDVIKPVIGEKRLPIVILDTRSVLKNRHSFSARGAGILGFSMFGRKPYYALDDDMSIDWKGLKAYLDKHRNSTILFFGFTYMIWKYMYQSAVEQGIQLDVGDSVLIHGGGWKKLQNEEVDSYTFKKALSKQFGIRRIHNYYGMVEQVGSIFVECEQGHLHTPNYAEVLIRDSITFEPLPFGKKGLIQVMSVLPKSYPGHCLLTEDIGRIIGEDDCPCGWKGKYFEVIGRIPKAELRGCSDTFAFEEKERSL